MAIHPHEIGSVIIGRLSLEEYEEIRDKAIAIVRQDEQHMFVVNEELVREKILNNLSSINKWASCQLHPAMAYMPEEGDDIAIVIEHGDNDDFIISLVMLC